MTWRDTSIDDFARRQEHFMPDEAENKNFFQQQREKLDRTPTEIGAMIGMSANTVRA